MGLEIVPQNEHASFNHPYTPYSIQLDFMNALYDTISSKKVGIFESPTGTGKTLSLICGAVTWLRDHQHEELERAISDESDEPEWVKEQAAKSRRLEVEQKVKDYEVKLARLRSVEESDRVKATEAKKTAETTDYKRRRKIDDPVEDEDFLVDDYFSDSETKTTGINGSVNANGQMYSSQVQALLDKLNQRPEADLAASIEPSTKIIYASRTHSQLSQFVGQLQLPSFPSGVCNESILAKESVKEISLSSRKHLCIHPKVSKIKNVTHMNDACRELQKNDSSKRCPYKLNEHKTEDKVRGTEFRDRALAKIRDIEDLAALGNSMGICPYYGARNAIPRSELIALPYQLLIQRQARDALCLDVKDSIIIIDEAHNIQDVVSSLFSVKISQTDVERALKGLNIYWTKFHKKLNTGNRVNLSQLITAVDALSQFFKLQLAKSPSSTSSGKEISPSDLFNSQTKDSVNAYKLEKYLEQSKLAYKVEGYLNKLDSSSGDQTKENSSSAEQVLSKILSFLVAASTPSAEGKLLYDRDSDNLLQIQYLLLDPSEQFRTLVEQARCLILAGGTMKPTEDFVNQLFPYLEPSQIGLFSCDHVVPKDNLAVYSMGTSASGHEMQFSFSKRSSESLMEEVGKTIVNLVRIIPKGVVIFFPSYSYLELIVKRWKKISSTKAGAQSIWQRLNDRKKVFMESQSVNVETVLSEYSREIDNNKGAILLSVVGGKMSEGINFSDDLARAIIMIGLPFPNMYSAEMVAKREYIQRKVTDRGGSKQEGMEAARDYYENLCMRAVNQSIGRAIRHVNDYAAIILLDKRYGTARIQSKLPNWISKAYDDQEKGCHKFPEVIRGVAGFFNNKKKMRIDS